MFFEITPVHFHFPFAPSEIRYVFMTMTVFSFSAVYLLSFYQLFILGTVCACNPGYFSYSKVVCNLWDIWMSESPNSAVRISSSQGQFASHFSPPGGRCTLLIANASTGKGFEIIAHSAYLDSSSSVNFFACDSPANCDPRPAVTWTGIAWNVQQFPEPQSNYKFTIVTDHPFLKIVLHVASSPVASNNFVLSWNSNPVCQPCPIPLSQDDDDKWSPYIERKGCALEILDNIVS